MRLVSFQSGQGVRCGAVVDGRIIDLNRGYAALLQQQGQSALAAQSQADQEVPSGIVAFLTDGPPARERAAAVLASSAAVNAPGVVSQEADTRLLAPVPVPPKIICIGQNYRDHCLEQNIPIPDEPVLFAKFSTCVIGPGHPVVLPSISQQVDYEAELAFVIGKTGKHVKRENAYDYVAGYMAAHDVSLRDIQLGPGQNKQWLRGKSADTSAPLGPYLVTSDEVPDPHTLAIKLTLNGQVMQDSNTSNLIYNIPFLIEFITQSITLRPGDVILTGTPPGVGQWRKPPVYLKAGDTVTVEIEKLGALTNPVVEDDGRTVEV